MARPLRLAIVGFGNVGRRFAELLGGAYRGPLEDAGIRPVVTAIASGRHGRAIDARGLPLDACLDAVRNGGTLDAFHRDATLRSTVALVRRAPADVLLELTPLDPRTGRPALDHVRTALARGVHVVTANKGPVAFARRRLVALAQRRGVRFLHEGAVMDGAPVFNLVERCLPGCRVLAFRGTLNATTSHVLARMEAGVSKAAAVAEMQAAGIAEADPRNDLDGWDAAVKGCALANVLLAGDVRPADVDRTGVARIGLAEVRAAAARGQRIRLVTRAARDGGRVRVRVAPERLPLGDPLAGGGDASVLVLQTDLMGEVGVIENGGTVDQTAYALLSDVLSLARRS
ncbi:MAG TPA: hypothetical protein VF469_16085 [Kofleriaceae bacterium]